MNSLRPFLITTLPSYRIPHFFIQLFMELLLFSFVLFYLLKQSVELIEIMLTERCEFDLCLNVCSIMEPIELLRQIDFSIEYARKQSVERICPRISWWVLVLLHSLRKQITFRDATNGFPAKWRLRNERRNSIPRGIKSRWIPRRFRLAQNLKLKDFLGSASAWSCRLGNLLQRQQ